MNYLLRIKGLSLIFSGPLDEQTSQSYSQNKYPY